MADLVLPRGKVKVLKAEDNDYDRGLLVKLLDDGGYKMAYWYNKPNKPMPVEIIVDGESIKKDGKIVEMKFHPKDYYGKQEESTMKLEELVGKKLTEEQFDEAAGEKDACYRKVKARYDVWPSAYASGALVKCRKVGAKNWGNKSKKESVNILGVKKINEGKFRVTFDIEDAKLGRYTTDVEAKDKKEAEKIVAAKFVGGTKLITKGKTKKLKEAKKDFKPHMMYNPKTGKGYKADTYADHVRMNKMGYVHEKPKKVDEMKFNESYDVWSEETGIGYTLEFKHDVSEAEYQGRKVKLGKPMQGDTGKFKVYVKNPKGNVVKVNFGAKGKKNRIKKSDPGRRKSFRARHNCDNPGPRHKARYWSCRKW